MISSADLPEEPGFPNKKIILALSLVLGTGLGAAFGMAREFLDRSIRTGRNVTDLGIPFFGFLPALSRRQARIADGRSKSGGESRSSSGPRRAKGAFGLLVDQMPADFVPVIRRIKIALDLRAKGSRPIVGISSVGDGEGKTVVAANLAAFEAKAGRKVLLIDANPHSLKLSEHFAVDDANGAPQVLLSAGDTAGQVRHLANGVDFLPMAEHGVNAETIASSVDARTVLSSLTAGYDVVFLDLARLDGMAETQALVSRLDAFVLVFEWGVTSQSEIEEVMRSVPGLHARTLGAVVNKANLSRVRLYEGHQRYSKAH